MENDRESLRMKIRKDIIMRNQLRGNLSYEAERMLEKCVGIEMEDTQYQPKYRPSFAAWGDDE